MARLETKSQLSAQFDALKRLVAVAAELALVCYDADGVITYFDKGAEALFGYRARDLVGRSSSAFLHGEENQNGLLRLLRRADAGGTTHEEDLFAQNAEGAAVSVRVIVTRVEDSSSDSRYLALYRDQTGKLKSAMELEDVQSRLKQNMVQTEREARFLRELLRHTIEIVQLGLVVQDLGSGMIAYSNEGFQRITGFSQLDTMAKRLDEVLVEYPGARKHLVEYVDHIRDSALGGTPRPAPGHWELEFPTGKKTVEVYGRPIVVEGVESQMVLLIIEDVTERERLQMKLVQSEKLAAVGQLAAGIAHEIRNPLNTIYNALFDLTEILQNRTHEVDEDITICMEEIRRVQDIINNLLDFARESERAAGHSNLNDVVRKTIRLVRHQLTNRHIKTEFELGDVPDVAINNNALKQILINLVTNAVQAMPEGGKLLLRTERRPGRVPLRTGDVHPEPAPTSEYRLGPGDDDVAANGRFGDGVYTDHVVLEISDSGSGIPAETLPNIFNPFFTTKAPGFGTGLGLSVVHSLVHDCGGAISVASTPGKGTTFTFEFPGYS